MPFTMLLNSLPEVSSWIPMIKEKGQRGIFLKVAVICGGVFVILLLLTVPLYIFRNSIISNLLESKLSDQLDASVKINFTNLNIWDRSLTLNGIEIGNPQGFRHPFSIRMPEFKIALENPMKVENKWMISEMIIDISEIVIERNLDGKFNLSKIAGIEQPASKSTSQPQANIKNKKTDKKPKEEVEFKIGTLILRVNQVSYYDYKVTNNPPRISYSVNINETLRDSNSVEEIKQRILQRIFSRIPLKLSDIMNPKKTVEDQKDKLKNKAKEQLNKLF